MTLRLVSPVHGLGQPLINRSQRIVFRLDGVEIKAYAGDTVLSAALAAGLVGAGRAAGAPLRLGTDYAPDIRARGDVDGAGVPMTLCPAVDGVDLVTLGTRPRATRRMATRISGHAGEGLPIDADHPLPAAAAETPEVETADVLVVGGGVAGMSTALAAAERGERVILVERRGRLGGDAPLFGNREDEDPALDAIAALESAIATRSEIDLRLYCEAFDAGSEGVNLRSVADAKSAPRLKVTRVAALHVVLATGCADRLAVFPGNRLPGVVGLAEAFHMAGAYGIWPDTPTLFAGGTNALYHLAMLSKESGAELVRLIDHRTAPHSRFIDFAKASGVPQEFATRIASIAYAKPGKLSVETALSGTSGTREGRTVFAAGSVVHSDGWRPRLTLWTRLGGTVTWNGKAGVPTGSRIPAGVALAGSVTGLLTTSGCRQSGRQAVTELFGDPVEPVTEHLLADYVESPDAQRLDALPSRKAPAFAASGAVLVTLPAAEPARRRAPGTEPGPGMAGALDLETIETLTWAGLSPAERFSDICIERLASPEVIVPERIVPEPDPGGEDDIPDYVRGRFAAPLKRIALASEDGRTFEPGLLVFVESGLRRPEEAIGVIVTASDKGGIAIVQGDACEKLTRVAVRDGARTIAALILD